MKFQCTHISRYCVVVFYFYFGQHWIILNWQQRQSVSPCDYQRYGLLAMCSHWRLASWPLLHDCNNACFYWHLHANFAHFLCNAACQPASQVTISLVSIWYVGFTNMHMHNTWIVVIKHTARCSIRMGWSPVYLMTSPGL